MSKYLYGAAVQGIQSFIFQTNKLREIVGASELVKEICTTLFARILYNDDALESEKAKEKLLSDENAILFAAGNIKYIFESKEQCEKVVKVFPKMVSEFAPGITASQAVVLFEEKQNDTFEKDGDLKVYHSFKSAVNELESRLRTQRNKPMRSQTIGMMGILRSPQSGLPVVEIRNNGEYLDGAKKAKLAYNIENISSLESLNEYKIAYDIEDITKHNDWIAIIHADGNGLGQIVQKIGTDHKEFREFSINLDKATTEAAVEAFKAIVEEESSKSEKKNFMPIRPIVLGGDDLTVVCRGDLALTYTSNFIKAFESKTHDYLGKIIEGVFEKGEIRDRLTACAGIAYVKSSFPFYYGYELAESLCSRAKKYAKDGDDIREGKELPLSCLMFHKVQSSFVEEYDEIVKKELKPQEHISFEFGPYFINIKKYQEKDWTVDELLNISKKLDNKEGNAVKSHLRNWLTLLHDNEDLAKQKLNRLISMTSNKELNNLVKTMTKGISKLNDTKAEKEAIITYPVYDILAIHTINTQKTKNNE